MAATQMALQFDSRSLLRQTFVWMTIGLVLTAVIAWLTSQSDMLTNFVVAQPMISLVSLGVWVLLGLGFGFFVRRVPAPIGIALFFIYCAFTGLSLSWVFVAYSEATIFYALISTVGLFVIITFSALFTRIDLTRWWMYIIFALLGWGLAAALNLVLFRSAQLDFLLSLAGVGLFSISTAATVQKIVKMEHELEPELHDRAAIIGAMMLYTNFINLFLRLLAIFGRSQNRR